MPNDIRAEINHVHLPMVEDEETSMLHLTTKVLGLALATNEDNLKGIARWHSGRLDSLRGRPHALRNFLQPVTDAAAPAAGSGLRAVRETKQLRLVK